MLLKSNYLNMFQGFKGFNDRQDASHEIIYDGECAFDSFYIECMKHETPN